MQDAHKETAEIPCSSVDASTVSTAKTRERVLCENDEMAIDATAPALSDTQQDCHDDSMRSSDALEAPVTSGEETSEVVVLPEVAAADPVSLPVDTAIIAPTAAEPAPAVQPRATEDLPLILCSLSIDSLHCIASFLPPTDWSNFGQANHATNHVCNQVFRRVRMHGFRCATEVVSAWVSCIMQNMCIAACQVLLQTLTI